MRREGDRSDRRVVQLRLTAQARSLGERIRERDDAIDSMIVRRLEGTDPQPVIDALRALVHGTNPGGKVTHRFAAEH